DDLLDFNIDSSAVQSESPESHADVDIDDAGAETLEFDAPLSLEIDSEDGQLTLDEQPIALEIGNDLYEESTDEPPLDLDLPDFKEDESSPLDTKTDEQIEELRVGDLDEPLASEAESDVEFDLGNFDEIDEAETKLDLASAYMDMGDPEGARNILEEVLADGNSEQKEKAQSLLNELS
ncbi:MAG: hypothetical protein GQ548_05390, partial [Methylophaga sp.]|nr:hypothetical protein [Methylophaga sp.]